MRLAMLSLAAALMLQPGIAVGTGPAHHRVLKQMRLRRFDGE